MAILLILLSISSVIGSFVFVFNLGDFDSDERMSRKALLLLICGPIVWVFFIVVQLMRLLEAVGHGVGGLVFRKPSSKAER